MVLKSVHTTPMLNSTSLSSHGSLALTSAFVFEAFIAHLVNQFSGTRGLPKKLNGGKTRSKPNLQGACLVYRRENPAV